MRRSYKFLLRPTSKQRDHLTQMLGDFCDLYNAALQERRDAYRTHGVSVSLGDQSAQLPFIRAELDHIKRWSAGGEQDVLRRLDRGFQAFFRRVRNGESPGFPRFRGRGWYNSATFDTGKGGVKWNTFDSGKRVGRGRSRKFETVTVYFQGIGHVKVHQHRQVQGTVKTITVKREGRGWYVVLSCDQVPEQPLEPTGKSVGVDIGITKFATMDDGSHVDNPRWEKLQRPKLTEMQRTISRRKVRGSNRNKAQAAYGNARSKLARSRKDWHHKTALQLVREYDTIYVEEVSVKQMLQSTGSDWGPKADRGRHRSLGELGWAQFISILTSKAESAGKSVVLVNPAYTSQTCPECGHVSRDNRNGSDFCCISCGHENDADVVGAINIKRRGQGLTSGCEGPDSQETKNLRAS